jgi:hypothetical protein
MLFDESSAITLNRLLVTRCHSELAHLAAIGKSAVGMTGHASTACWGSWCEGLSEVTHGE